MIEQLISFETAKLAKEKGFDIKNSNTLPHFSTQSLLQKWLREIHGIHIVLIPTITSFWTYKIITVSSKRDDEVILGIKSVSDLPPYKKVCGYDFSTYEEALEVGLVEGLKLIKV